MGEHGEFERAVEIELREERTQTSKMSTSNATGSTSAAFVAVGGAAFAAVLYWLGQRNPQGQPDPSGKEKKKEAKGDDAKAERKREKKEMKEAEKKLKKRLKDLQK